jgi:hypothetical protein
MLEDTFLFRVFAAPLNKFSWGGFPPWRIAFLQLSRGAVTRRRGFYGQRMNLEIETLETRGFEIYNHGQTAGS